MTRLVQLNSPFRAEGRWFRGNTHTHTTNSDGHMSPENVITHYAYGSYDFLFFTDHHWVTDLTGASTDTFLVMRGTEVGAGEGRKFHLLGLGASETYERAHVPPAQDAVDFLREQGALVIVGHPYFSGLTLNDILPLQGVTALEVYNATCESTIGRGHAMVHWDDVLSRGMVLSALAVDDCHRPGFDSHRGWTMVKAPALTRDAVMDALRNGQFYCSTGPIISDVSWNPNETAGAAAGGTVRVRCSPARAITLVTNAANGCRLEAGRLSDGRRGRRLRIEDQMPEGVRHGDLLTGAEFLLAGSERYARVQVEDEYGRLAWTNPLFVQIPE